MNFRVNDIVDVLGLARVPEHQNRAIRRFQYDASKVQFGGDLYYINPDPAKGRHSAYDAANGGASAVLTSNPPEPRLRALQLQVPSVPLAMGAIAKKWRNRLDPTMIAITGSCGKTTAKDLIAHIFRDFFGKEKVLAAFLDWDGHYGVPTVLSMLKKEHKYAILEVAVNMPGDMKVLAPMVRPNVALILNIEPVHLESMQTLRNLAREKTKLLKALPKDGIAVINRDSDFFDIFQDVVKKKGCKMVTFGVHTESDVRIVDVFGSVPLVVQLTTTFPQLPTIRFKTELLGNHNARSVAAATAVALALGVPLRDHSCVLNVKLGFGHLHQLYGDVNIINDCNSLNPAGVKASIDLLTCFPPKRILVLSDMQKLGRETEEYHKEIGEYAKREGIDGLLGYGEWTKYAVECFGVGALDFGSEEKLFESILLLLKHIKQGTILVNGARRGLTVRTLGTKLLEHFNAGKLHSVTSDSIMIEY